MGSRERLNGRSRRLGGLAVAAASMVTLASCQIAIVGAPVLPCTMNWVGPDGGTFDNPANWDTASAPTASDEVCNNSGATISIATDVTVKSASIGTGVVEPGVTFTVTDATFGALDMKSGSTLAGDGSGIIAGTFDNATIASGTGNIQLLSPSIGAGGLTLQERTTSLVGSTNLSGTIALCDANVLVGESDSVTIVGGGGFVPVCASGTLQTSGVITVSSGLSVALPTVINSGTVTIEPGASADAAGYQQSTGTTTIMSSASLAVTSGAGTLSLDGGLLNGSGTVDASVAGEGTVSPADALTPGTMTITGSYTPGTYEITLGGTAPGQYDTLAVDGTILLTSGTETLAGVPVNGYSPTSGDFFVGIMTTATPFGINDYWDVPVLPNPDPDNYGWNQILSESAMDLEYAAAGGGGG